MPVRSSQTISKADVTTGEDPRAVKIKSELANWRQGAKQIMRVALKCLLFYRTILEEDWALYRTCWFRKPCSLEYLLVLHRLYRKPI